MTDLLIGNDTAVITMLLLFITGILTKRIVPWYVHEEALTKLKKYEDAAPGLITEVNRLMEVLDKKTKNSPVTTNHRPHRGRTFVQKDVIHE